MPHLEPPCHPCTPAARLAPMSCDISDCLLRLPLLFNNVSSQANGSYLSKLCQQATTCWSSSSQVLSEASVLSEACWLTHKPSCRWVQVAYAEMSGVGSEEEAAARLSSALGLPSYPLPLNETLRLCTWLKGRPASMGCLGELHVLCLLDCSVALEHKPLHKCANCLTSSIPLTPVVAHLQTGCQSYTQVFLHRRHMMWDLSWLCPLYCYPLGHISLVTHVQCKQYLLGIQAQLHLMLFSLQAWLWTQAMGSSGQRM